MVTDNPDFAHMPTEATLLTVYLAKRLALRQFLVTRLRNREEADDALQDLYLKVRRAGDEVDLSNPVSYLFKMAVNLARDQQRGKRRAVLREEDWGNIAYGVAGGQSVADTPSAEDAYAAKQKLAAVRAALETLSPQCQRAFLLHKFEGLSHREVAERLDISTSTVEKHMNTAMKHLIRTFNRDQNATL